MRVNEDADEVAVVVKFMHLYAADLAADAVRPLSEYQARFPGYEEVIARELVEFGADLATLGPDVTLARGDERTVAGLSRALRDARYDALDQIGRGGMGIVLRVRDQRLRRDLAMKILASSPTDGGGIGSPAVNSLQLQRFLDEAQLTGQLSHPGIVPVHDLGIDDAGRVYFTMSLIQGRDFREVIRRVHDQADTEWTLARAASVLLRVCESVAFAHAKGVIHRDLKPANVMVGGFGETYVLDWGLARVIGGAGSTEIRLDRPRDPGSDDGGDHRDSTRTMDGDVVGTPAYMAPEQARGELDLVGKRADVYSIGAMTYHLLTGAIPYADSAVTMTSRAVLDRVIAGPPRAIADLAPHAPAELAAICEKAMMRVPEDRYASVAELAVDLRAFLELRVVNAYETGALAEARKWVRRNRSFALLGAAAIVALAVGLVFSVIQKRFADAQASRADANFRLATSAVDRMLTRVGESELRDVPQMDELRTELLEAALMFHRDLLERQRDDPAAQIEVTAALARLAGIQRMLGDYAAAEAAAREAIERWGRLDVARRGRVDALDGMLEARTNLGTVLAALGEHDDAQLEFQRGIEATDSALHHDPDDLKILQRRAVLINDMANALTARGEWQEAAAPRREAARLARLLLERLGNSRGARTFATTALANLGMTLTRTGEFEEAERMLLQALEVAAPASDAHERSRGRRVAVAGTWASLASVQHRTGRDPAAIASLERAAEMYRELIGDHPRVAEYRVGLGRASANLANLRSLEDGGDAAQQLLEESIREYAIAVELAPGDREYARALRGSKIKLCALFMTTGDLDAAATAAMELGAIDAWGAASVLADCAARTLADLEIPADDRAHRFDDFAASAIDFMRTALHHTDDPARARSMLEFANQPQLDPIRNLPDFIEVVREAEERAR